VSEREQISEEKEDQVHGELSNDLDVPEKETEEVKGGIKPIERDPTVAGH